jgi:hypothetical protein
LENSKDFETSGWRWRAASVYFVKGFEEGLLKLKRVGKFILRSHLVLHSARLA